MRKFLFVIASLFCFSFAASSQLMVSKPLGKNAKNSKIGFGTFLFYDFPLQQSENRSLRLELLDFAFFPKKDDNLNAVTGYISIKVGYKHIFSETKTGFYLEPAVGYCRVVLDDPTLTDALYGDGIALALEGGYSLEVGERGNTFTFGVKYEADKAGTLTSISSVGFRVAYSFGLFKRSE